MAKLDLRDQKNDKVGDIDLDPSVFEAKGRSHVLYEQVKSHLAGLRAGTHSTKTRAQVAGGGKRPWRQKGTGRARAGTIRSPLWRGGGTTHGPQPHLYELKTNRKTKKLAMRLALTAKLADGGLIVVDSLELAEAKTKQVVTLLKGLGIEGRILLVDDASNENLRLAARNHPKVKVVAPSALSTYDVLQTHRLVMTQASAAKIQELFKS